MLERTKLQELQGLFSDVHKDVHGFRPRSIWEKNWNNEEWLAKQVDTLSDDLSVLMDEEKIIQDGNVVSFENKVKELISIGASDRETAVRWLLEGDDCQGDIGYLEYKFNIPYGYINQ
jgi:hypothetical protein